MRFYKCDGTCKSNCDDRDFGWWLCDILDVDDESANNCQEDFPSVKEHFPVCAVKSFANTEGCVPKNKSNHFCILKSCCDDPKGELQYLRLSDFRLIKSRLLEVISLESKEENVLLSLIDDKKLFKNSVCIKESYKTGELKRDKPTRYPVKKYNFKCNCNLNLLDLTFPKSSTFIGLKEAIKVLHKNVYQIKSHVDQMRVELDNIRIDLQIEDQRALELLTETRKLTQERRESNYLNEVLLLLMGQAEKIQSNKWPFKMCRNPNHNDEPVNLII